MGSIISLDEILAHTHEAVSRERNTDWHWEPPECLAELKSARRRRRAEGATITASTPYA
jgi:hypothetical protein